MPVYRLIPVVSDDPRWQGCAHRAPVLVVASSPARARQMAAQKLAPVENAPGSAQGLQSPWLVDTVTKCEVESWTNDSPLGTVRTADGTPL